MKVDGRRDKGRPRNTWLKNGQPGQEGLETEWHRSCQPRLMEKDATNKHGKPALSKQ